MTLKDRQINGLMCFLAAAMIMYVAGAACFWKRPPDVKMPGADIRSGPVVIELMGESPRTGIYYLPEKTTLLQFLTMAGVEYSNSISPGFFQPLKSGSTIRINVNGQATQEKMKSVTRLALNLPIDVNRSTFEEIILVPGVGESTARQILELRRSAGGQIHNLESLMMIKGIKEKRFERLKGYFYVE